MVFWRAVGDAIAVAVKVRPRSRRPGLHGPKSHGPAPHSPRLGHAGLRDAEPHDAGLHDTALDSPSRHNGKPHAGLPDADDERLTIAVREPPQDGRANRAACAALAAAVGVPPSYVEIASGAASRRKTLLVSGDAAAIAARLAAL